MPDITTAIATVGLVIVGFLQLLLFWQQLKFIRKSLTDTEITAKAAKESAEASKNQTELSKKAFSATQRPWISVELQMGGALSYKDDDTMCIPIMYNLNNVGHSPATNININLMITLEPTQESTLEVTPYKLRKILCDSAEKMPLNRNISQFVLFPKCTMSRLHTSLVPIRQFSEKKRTPLDIFVVCCVSYSFTFESEIHKVSFIMKLAHRDFSPISINDGTIEAKDLCLGYDLCSNYIAD